MQKVYPKYQYISTRIHNITSQDKTLFINQGNVAYHDKTSSPNRI